MNELTTSHQFTLTLEFAPPGEGVGWNEVEDGGAKQRTIPLPLQVGLKPTINGIVLPFGFLPKGFS